MEAPVFLFTKFSNSTSREKHMGHAGKIGWFSWLYGLKCVPMKQMLKFLPPVPQFVNLFLNKVFTIAVKLK